MDMDMIWTQSWIWGVVAWNMEVLKQFEDAHTFIIFDHCYECLSLITSISTLSLSMT